MTQKNYINNKNKGNRFGRLPFILVLLLILLIWNTTQAKAAQTTNYQCIDTILDYLNTNNKWNASGQDTNVLQNFYTDMNNWNGIFVMYNPNRIEIRQVSELYEITTSRIKYRQTTGRYYTIYTSGNSSGMVTSSSQSYGNGEFYYTNNFNPNAYNTGVFIIGSYNNQRIAYQLNGFDCFDINNGIIQSSEFIPRASSYLDIQLTISGGQVNCIGIPWTSYLPDYKLGEFYGVENPQEAYITFNEIQNGILNEIYNWNNISWNQDEQWIYVPTTIVELRKPYVLEYSFDGIIYEHYYYYFENIEITEGIYQNNSGEWIYGEISGDLLQQQKTDQMYDDIQNINSNIGNLSNTIQENNNKWSGELLSEMTETTPSGDTKLSDRNIITRAFNAIWDILFRIDEHAIKLQLENFENIMKSNDNILNIPFYLFEKMIKIFINYTPNEDFILSWEPLEFSTRYSNTITMFDDGNNNEFNVSQFVRENEWATTIYNYYIIIISAAWIYLFAGWLRAIWLDIISVNWLGNNIEMEEPLPDTSTKLETYTTEVETIGEITPNGVKWKDNKTMGGKTKFTKPQRR